MKTVFRAGLCLAVLLVFSCFASAVSTQNFFAAAPKNYDYSVAMPLSAQGIQIKFPEKTLPLTGGKYQYTVNFRNNFQSISLYAVLPNSNDTSGVYNICRECPNPTIFTSDYDKFDLNYYAFDYTTQLNAAIMVLGVKEPGTIDIDQSIARQISVPNSNSFFIDLIGRQPNYFFGVFHFRSNLQLMNLAIIGDSEVRPYLHGFGAFNDYVLEQGYGIGFATSDVTGTTLAASVDFAYPFNELIKSIPPEHSEKVIEITSSLSNPANGTSSYGGGRLLASFYSPYRVWHVGEKAYWRMLNGQITPFFNNYPNVGGFSGDFGPPDNACRSFFTRQVEQPTNSLMKPPIRLALKPIIFEFNDNHQGIFLYALDSNNQEFEFFGNWMINSSFVNVTTPSGRRLQIFGLNGGNLFCPESNPRPFTLACGNHEWDLLGPCEFGGYKFYFDATGIFLEQKLCLNAEAFYKSTTGFVLTKQTPGLVVNGRCVTNTIPTATAVDKANPNPAKLGAAAFAPAPAEQKQDLLPYWIAGIAGLLVVIGALVWFFKRRK